MAPPRCRYCEIIRGADPKYRGRPARHALGSSHPRCDTHWRFVCGACGKARHFHGISFCPRRRAFYCIECSPNVGTVRRRFWGWAYQYRMACPWHRASHDALDRLERDGRHPWQRWPSWRRARRGMSASEDLPARWAFRVEPAEAITDADIRKGWDDVAEWWVSRYSPRGDINREWVIDPALLELLGEVAGLRVLDAGCGTAYLARLLAARGASVDGVDQSPKLLEAALREEAREPLGVRLHRGDLADLSMFRDETFDLAVSNIVLQDVRRLPEAVREIHRVLRPGGRFVFSITHPAFEAPVPGTWIREPPDTERVEERRYLAVDRYFDRAAVWWGPPGKPLAVGFHRPLRDYFAALHEAGFLVRRFEEPLPLPKALERDYRLFADMLRIPNFLIIEAVKTEQGPS